jgi:hypothetical protein
MAELSAIDIVELAVGMKRSGFKLNPIEWEKVSKDKALRECARQIVLGEMERLTRGEDVDVHMRWLIGMWCRQELRGGKCGRPKSEGKEEAIYSAFEAITNDAKGQKLQGKAIISHLAEKFGVKERRVYEALERQDPAKRFKRTMERIGRLLQRSTLSAEAREWWETMYKRVDRLRLQQLRQQRR